MRTSEPDIEQAVRTLTADGTLAPLELGGTDERTWADCDLAALAELRLAERIDLGAMDDARRADLAARVTTERLSMPSARGLDRCFWILADGRRAGTVALATSTLGGRRVRLSSLYVYPPERGRGTGRRLLERIAQVLGAHGLGVRLETCWTWPATLRFYFRLGMWVRMWKRDVDLWLEAGVPRPVIEIGERVATLSVDVNEERVVLVRAERDGERLATFEEPWLTEWGAGGDGDPEVEAVAWDASTTLAVAMARCGWPLLRTPDAWKPRWAGDGGDPEGLAYRIVCWEAWAKAHGWRVETPRVAGLRYPTWQELQAEWGADRE